MSMGQKVPYPSSAQIFPPSKTVLPLTTVFTTFPLKVFPV